jgi:DNA topoisomerase-3
MEMRGDGENKLFVCPCGFREKLAAFTKRREGKGDVNKKDVHQYLQQQSKNESINTALADALNKLMKRE